MMSLLCLSSSKSIIVENIFEARFKHVLELRKMGAHIDIKDQEAIIYPCDALYGADVYAKDLRGGAALVLAGLCAKGQTVVYGTEHIKRGYYSMVMDLAKLGADLDEIK
jgi:UDP-N-acetylglucosamine 1-carboxyvinyltransferase